MNKSLIGYAERAALNLLDEWNETTGVFNPSEGYYSEIVSIIVDAVHVGIHSALYGKVQRYKTGDVKKSVLEYPESEKVTQIN